MATRDEHIAPTREEIFKRVTRGGRIFLFEYPARPGTNGIRMPDDDAHDRILDALQELPFCKEVEGPLINGLLVITVDDQDMDPVLTDDAVRAQISDVIAREWR